jgi:hypothetical protein
LKKILTRIARHSDYLAQLLFEELDQFILGHRGRAAHAEIAADSSAVVCYSAAFFYPA